MSRNAAAVQSRETSITAALAAQAAATRLDAIPAPVRAVARQSLLDWLGVALAGAAHPAVRIVLDQALSEGCAAQSTLLGRGERVSCVQAALVNGTAGHVLDFDDVHFALPGHPSAVVAPAVLALAEHRGASGAQALAALVVGIETACRVGRYVTGAHYERGWHATGTVGTFGAAAGCARLIGLDAHRTAFALGIAGTQAAGLRAMFGTMCKSLHAGKASANGLYAALLAERGFEARPDVLECARGFAATQSSGADVPAALELLGTRWLMRDLLFKYHAACYGTHATIEAARSLIAEHALSADDIAAVEIKVKPRYLEICNIEQPRTGLEAKFSLRMTCAMALAGEPTAAVARYDDALCELPRLRRLLDRIHVTASEELGDGASELVVTLASGVVYRARGDVSAPAEDLGSQGARLRQKFDALAEPAIGRDLAEELATLVTDIERLQDLRALMALTRG